MNSYKNYLGETITNCPKGEGKCTQTNHLTKKQYKQLQTSNAINLQDVTITVNAINATQQHTNPDHTITPEQYETLTQGNLQPKDSITELAGNSTHITSLNPVDVEYPTHLTATQIVEKYALGDLNEDEGYFEETETEFLKRRYSYAHENGLADKIFANGYNNDYPIEIYDDRMINDGHHRLAVMFFTNPDQPIPLTHSDE